MIEMGKTYRTRDGQTVQLVSVEGRGLYPVIGYIGGGNMPDVWMADGRADFDADVHRHNLVEVSEPREWTIQVDADGKVYPHSMLVTGVYPINGPIETVHVREVLEGEK